MEYLEKNTIKNDVIDLLINEMEDYEDEQVYCSEFAYSLLERYNVDGSITYSTYKAIEWIQAHFEELGEVVEEIQANFGDDYHLPNVFDRPEAFMVVIFLEVGSYLASQCQFINDNWNEEVTLTRDVIDTIKSQLEALKEAI